jgi:hypothetical protein
MTAGSLVEMVAPRTVRRSACMPCTYRRSSGPMVLEFELSGHLVRGDVRMVHTGSTEARSFADTCTPCMYGA